MSDLARSKPPGQELAHSGNVTPQQRPPGQELATNRNQDLGHAYPGDITR